jgi:outer membrane lipoprotein-sorting protein
MSQARPAGTLLLLALLAIAHAADAKPLKGEAFLDAVKVARAARKEQIKSVRADVVIGLSSKSWSGAGTCQGRIAARRPDSLRLLGYAAVATVFDATTDGDHFWLYLPMLERAITGKAEEESLLAALPILPTEIVGALFGEPYGAPESGLRMLDVKGTPWVTWRLASGHEVRARYAPGSMLLQRAELWGGDTRLARLDYHDYRKRSGVWWPTRLDFDWPAEQGHLSLTFDTVRFNEKIDDSAFRFEAPDGVLVVPVSSGDAFGEASR